MVSIEEFKSIDIRVGKIIDVKVHDAARNPMYVLRIDFGADVGERTIVAGIRDKYAQEELLGKKIACIVNLPPKMIAGVESNGMILAADSGDVLSVLVPDREIAQGSRVH